MARSRGTATYHIQSQKPDLDFLLDMFDSHTVIGDSDPIPGLKKGDVELPLSEMELPLVMHKKTTYTIKDISIFALPSVEHFEQELLQRLEQDFRVHMCSHVASLSKGTLRISERKLKVGVHNGSRFSNDPIFFNLTLAGFDLNDITASHSETSNAAQQKQGKRLEFKGSFDIDDVPLHGRYAIVFQLEYRLTTTFIANTAHGQQPMDMDKVVVLRSVRTNMCCIHTGCLARRLVRRFPRAAHS